MSPNLLWYLPFTSFEVIGGGRGGLTVSGTEAAAACDPEAAVTAEDRFAKGEGILEGRVGGEAGSWSMINERDGQADCGGGLEATGGFSFTSGLEETGGLRFKSVGDTSVRGYMC